MTGEPSGNAILPLPADVTWKQLSHVQFNYNAHCARSIADAWKAGLPEELVTVASATIAFLEANCPTVPESKFDSPSKPEKFEKWESISTDKNMKVGRPCREIRIVAPSQFSCLAL